MNALEKDTTLLSPDSAHKHLLLNCLHVGSCLHSLVVNHNGAGINDCGGVCRIRSTCLIVVDSNVSCFIVHFQSEFIGPSSACYSSVNCGKDKAIVSVPVYGA